jgi:hypothetical protein
MKRAAKYHLSVYVDKSLVTRADALLRFLARDASVTSLAQPNRSTVIRMALSLGLAALEAKYRGTP